MNRHQMLMGKLDQPKVSKVPLKRKIIKEERDLTLNEIGLDGTDLETTISRLRQLQDSEKAKGNFTIRLIVHGGYDGDDTDFSLYTERYETDEDLAKREAAARKREEQKKAREARLAAQLKDPRYQKSLIDRMNERVNGRKTRYKYI